MNVDERHDSLFREALELTQGNLLLGPVAPSRPWWWTRRKLARAEALFQEVLQLAPENWSAMWLLGKVSQRLERHEDAWNWFRQALVLQSENIDVAREAMIEAIETGRYAEAIAIGQTALERAPKDVGLWLHLAMAQLLSGRDEDCADAASRALALRRGEPLGEALASLAGQVRRAARERPSSAHELRGALR